IILERHVMRDVVRHRVVEIGVRTIEFRARLRNTRVAGMRGAAHRDATILSGGDSRSEAAREPTPGNLLGVEKVADVFAEKLRRPTRRAIVEKWVDVADESSFSGCSIVDDDSAGSRHGDRCGITRARR